MDAATGQVITSALSSLPSIIAAIRAAHASANPAAPAITDAEALAALHQAVVESAATDDRLAALIANGR